MRKSDAVFKIFVAQTLFSRPQQILKHTCSRVPPLKLLSRTVNTTCSAMVLKKSLSDWSFADPALANLPLDPETKNFVRRSVPGSVFSLCQPTPWTSPPKLVAYSKDVLKNILELDECVTDSEEFARFVSGNLVLPGSIPLAHR